MASASIPVSLFWYQEDIPAPVRACLASWCDADGLDAAVFTARDALAFFDARGLERERAAFERCGPYAMASDYFRLHLLLDRGGLYVDANWAQRRALAPLLDGLARDGCHGLLAEVTDLYRARPDPLGMALIAQGGEMLLNGIVFMRAPGDPFVALCAEICLRNIEEGVCEQIAFAAGSGVMAALLVLRAFETRRDYVTALEGMAALPFDGKDISASIAAVIAATEGHDHATLRRHFQGIRAVPGASLQAHVSRDGLGQTHKDHWTRHKGSLYRPRRAD